MPAAAAPTAAASSQQQPVGRPAAQPAAEPATSAAAAGGAAAAAPSPGGNADEAKLQQLQGLGFSREQAVEALSVSNGDADRAASYLFETAMGF